MQARTQQLEEDRLTVTTQLAGKKEECLAQARDIVQLREAVVSLETRLSIKEGEAAAAKDYLIQLEVEKELRAKAETREDSERRERTAAMGQLSAIKYECDSRVREVEERSAVALEALRSELECAFVQHSVDLNEVRTLSEKIIGLESQVEQMQHALENASVNHQSVAELGLLTGQLEIERSRHAEALRTWESEQMKLIKELGECKEQLRVEEVMRRKLHNQVAELQLQLRQGFRADRFPGDAV